MQQTMNENQLYIELAASYGWSLTPIPTSELRAALARYNAMPLGKMAMQDRAAVVRELVERGDEVHV